MHNKPVNRQVQKSYNWAYGALSGSVRMLPFLAARTQRKPLAEADKMLWQFQRRLQLAGEELRTLEVHLDLPLFGAAAQSIDEACGLLTAAVEESKAGREQDARSKVDAAHSKLSRVKLLLDAQSPVKFKVWFLNPWQNWSRRIGQALPRRRDLKRRDGQD